MAHLKFINAACFLLLFTACSQSGGGGSGSSSDDSAATIASTNDEMGQQVGDTMASLDEIGGDSGSFVFNHWKQRFSWPSLFTPAYATSCLSLSTFSSCSDNVIVRTFDDCTLGLVALTGTVTFTYGDLALDNSCQMVTQGHFVARDPEYSARGPAGVTYSVQKTGTFGQVVVRGPQAATFAFANDGIRRILKDADGKTLFDFSTQTVSDIGISGANRLHRLLNGGVLRITNNESSLSCDLTPTDVFWGAGCLCANSGSWSGSCSDGDTFSIAITGCGVATLTKGGNSQTINFDRCDGV